MPTERWHAPCAGALPAPAYRGTEIVGRQDRQRAKVSIPDPEMAERQRTRLMAEGVVLDEGSRICLRTYGWLPCE